MPQQQIFLTIPSPDGYQRLRHILNELGQLGHDRAFRTCVITVDVPELGLVAATFAVFFAEASDGVYSFTAQVESDQLFQTRCPAVINYRPASGAIEIRLEFEVDVHAHQALLEMYGLP